MTYDAIVIGAGSAGCVAAARLSENPARSVLLLEAGPDYPDLEHLPDDLKYGYTRAAEIKRAPHNWSLTGHITSAQGPIHVAQGKVIGGSGAINGQVFLRGLPDDYDRVHGLEGLRVADASVMSHVIRANTNATAIMIGERVADWIKGLK